MQFSDETLGVLKNFSRINQSIMFRPGQKIRTISPQKTVMAEANVAENFPESAGVYDISRFIGTLTLFNSPDVAFEKENFRISNDKSELKYTYTAENMIVTPPDKDINIPNVEATLEISSATLENVAKAADVLGLPEICFSAQGGNIYISAVDSRNSTSDSYRTNVAEDVGCNDFNMYIKKEYLRLLQGDYTVTLSKSGMAHFKSSKVKYWVACDSK